MSKTVSPQAIQWALAAAAGLTLTACPQAEKKSVSDGAQAKAAAAPTAALTHDKECCMGKNDCKGQGGCAVPEGNDCAGKNECKGQGGCNMHCPQ
ncbi:MAG: hypothetical protein MK135_02475 [Polyangiaceae bacterium]|nr:hypothetical protein [Polyangiaceae bacterium]